MEEAYAVSSRRGARSAEVDQMVGWTGPMAAIIGQARQANFLERNCKKVFGRKRRKHKRRLLSSGIEQWRCSEPNTHWNRSRAKEAAGRLDEPRERGCLGVFAIGWQKHDGCRGEKGGRGPAGRAMGDLASPLGDRIGRHAWERLEIASPLHLEIASC
jgi:hypothetical protein